MTTDKGLIEYFAIVQHTNDGTKDIPHWFYEFPTEEELAEAAKDCNYVTIERRYEVVPFT